MQLVCIDFVIWQILRRPRVAMFDINGLFSRINIQQKITLAKLKRIRNHKAKILREAYIYALVSGHLLYLFSDLQLHTRIHIIISFSERYDTINFLFLIATEKKLLRQAVFIDSSYYNILNSSFIFTYYIFCLKPTAFF